MATAFRAGEKTWSCRRRRRGRNKKKNEERIARSNRIGGGKKRGFFTIGKEKGETSKNRESPQRTGAT